MFTGLVEVVGVIAGIEVRTDGARCRIAAPGLRPELVLGESVAIDGACLTVAELVEDGFEVDAVSETLARTALGDRRVGDRVNLERAVRADQRLGGHIVQGHIDGTASVIAVEPAGTGVRMTLHCDGGLLRYVVEKGSVTLDGVSLTVAARAENGFDVALIPHTLAHTTLGGAQAGRRVNIEVDVLAKYVEALAAPYRPGEGAG